MKPALALLGVGVAFGFMVGSCSDPVPDTKIVKVPAPPVVMTKKITETEYVTRELPESCATAIDLMTVIVDTHGRIASLANRIGEDVSNITRDQTWDPDSILGHEVTLHKLLTKLDERLSSGSLEAEKVMDDQYFACIRDVERSNAGEAVIESDGQPTKLYAVD